MKHYKSVEDLINDYWLAQITDTEAVICARYFDRERLNLQVVFNSLANEFWVLLFKELKANTPTPDEIKDRLLTEAIQKINKDTCPLCQTLTQQNETIQFVGNQVYHQSCWLSRDKSTEL